MLILGGDSGGLDGLAGKIDLRLSHARDQSGTTTGAVVMSPQTSAWSAGRTILKTG